MGVPEECYTALQTHAAFAADTIAKIISIGTWIIDQPDGAKRTLARYARVLGWLGPAADASGSKGLCSVCECLLGHLSDLADCGRGLTGSEHGLLTAWPGLVLDYLAAPSDPHARRALVDHLRDGGWIRPSGDDVAAAIEVQLDAPGDGFGGLRALRADTPTDVGAGIVGAAGAATVDAPTTDTLSAPALEEPNDAPIGQSESEPELSADVDGFPGDDMLAEIDALRNAVSDSTAMVPPAGRMKPIVQGLTALVQQADAAGMTGLVDICLRLAERATAVGADVADAEAWRAELDPFPDLVADYVAAPQEARTQDRLVAFLMRPALQIDLGPDEAELLRLLLQPPEDAAQIELSAQAAPPPPATGNDESAVETGATAQAEAAPQVPARGPGTIQRVNPEMLKLFGEELDGVFASLDEALSAALRCGAEESRGELARYAEEIGRLAAGAEAVGLPALKDVLLQLPERVSSLLEAGNMDEARQRLLGSLAQRLHDYLDAPADPGNASALVELLRDDAAGAAAPSEVDARIIALTAVELAPPEAAEPEERPIVAKPEDVSLAVPEDINQELLDGLLGELPTQTSAFTDAVQRIAAGRGGLKDIDDAKRAAHTLKGAANTVGVRGIANLTHHLEDILIVLAEHAVLPNLGLSQTLGYAADCLEGMSDALIGSGDMPEDAVNVLQDVLNWANRIARDGIAIAAGGRAGASPSGETDAKARKPDAHHQADSMLRVPANLIDELLRLVGETMTTTAQIQNRLDQTFEQARALSRQNGMFRQLVSDMEKLVDIRGVALPHQSRPHGEFDTLELEQYSELQTVTRRLIEVATDTHELGLANEEHLAALNELVNLQGRLHLEQQSVSLRTRMVPVRSIASRLQRAVRQACRLLDKEVELEIEGADTLIDGNVLNEIVDPLMHVLRNAVDHGIEAVEQRAMAGKSPVGRLDLSFKREGDHITVRFRDDGAGLDLPAIRRAAERKGIVDPAVSLTEDQLRRLILAPGFSTREEATQVSGRGIGLDAVNAKVLELKGSLNLLSERGKGLTVEIRLPLSLLSAHALLVRMRDSLLAVSTRGIEDIVYVAADQLEALANQIVYRHGDRLLDVVRLDTLLNLPRDRREAERRGHPLLLVRLDSGAFRAVLVQEVLDSRSVTVKPLGRYVGKIGGVVGATILGDGSVAPVIDLQEMLRALEREQSGRNVHWTQGGAARADTTILGGKRAERWQALIVDDSVSARRTTSQIVKDAGFEVRTAIDGLEAVTILERMVPTIIITDMEMPRMNGLELTSHIRARENTRDVPVIMITSRSTEKHRQRAEASGVDAYLTKPFSAEVLIKHIGMLTRATA